MSRKSAHAAGAGHAPPSRRAARRAGIHRAAEVSVDAMSTTTSQAQADPGLLAAAAHGAEPAAEAVVPDEVVEALAQTSPPRTRRPRRSRPSRSPPRSRPSRSRRSTRRRPGRRPGTGGAPWSPPPCPTPCSAWTIPATRRSTSPTRTRPGSRRSSRAARRRSRCSSANPPCTAPPAAGRAVCGRWPASWRAIAACAPACSPPGSPRGCCRRCRRRGSALDGHAPRLMGPVLLRAASCAATGVRARRLRAGAPSHGRGQPRAAAAAARIPRRPARRPGAGGARVRHPRLRPRPRLRRPRGGVLGHRRLRRRAAPARGLLHGQAPRR